MRDAFGADRPNTYSSAAWIKAVAAIGATVCLAVCGLIASSGDPTALAAVGVFTVLMSLWAGVVLRRRLTVWPDRFEFQGLFRRVSGRKNDLAGYRTTNTRSGTYLHFHLKDGRRFTLPDYRDRPGLSTWMSGLTDLDAQDKAEFEAGLMANSAFGTDPARRQRAITFQRHLLTGINIVGGACAAWLFFFPKPLLYARLACAALPLAALVLAATSNGRWALMWDMKNPRLKLTAAFLLPLIALGATFFLNDDILDKMAAATPALAVAAVVMGLVVLIDRKIAFPAVVWTAALVGAGAWGGVLLYNEVQDTAPPAVYQTVVVDKHIYEGRRSTSYYVDVAPWGPADTPTSLEVDSASYRLAASGQPVCVRLHKGALGYRWIDYSCTPDPVTG